MAPKKTKQHRAGSRIRVSHTRFDPRGVRQTSSRVLGPHGIAKDKNEQMRSEMQRQRDVSAQQQREAAVLEHVLQEDLPAARDILEGNTRFELSHDGGEWEDIYEDTIPLSAGRGRIDDRSRRDRTQRRVHGFDSQMEEMVDAYMQWSVHTAAAGMDERGCSVAEEESDDRFEVRVVDMYNSKTEYIYTRPDDRCIASAFIWQGFLPCAPFRPKTAFTIRAVEIYRLAHLRSPGLSAQAFVKALCDAHGRAYHRYLTEQFRIAFDLLLAIRDTIDLRVMKELGREGMNWRVKNTCPCCTYKLKGEPELELGILTAGDGNNSLKRIARKESDVGAEGSTSRLTDRPDPRVGGGTYYLTRQEVDRFAKERVDEWLKSWNGGMVVEEAAETVAEDNPCTDRWKNLAQDLAAKMWGVYEETGIFVSLCRHGFVLVVADMICSGELSKYPLAVVNRLLDVFDGKFVFGYDIGCGFETTVSRSPLAAKAAFKHLRSLVGLFHGHAHNRLCQLKFLGTYIKGLGLEDLEGCERLFSRLNALAAATRHMSPFHRLQAITTYLQHLDNFDTYQNLSRFLCNNYRQALDIIATQPILRNNMDRLKITSEDVFDSWLEEERAYLQSLTKEPEHETLQMEYFQRLVKLQQLETLLNTAQSQWELRTPADQARLSYQKDAARIAVLETDRRHALENRDLELSVVQSLESKLQVSKRWTPDMPEWAETQVLVLNRHYQRCVDRLEGLIVSRLFEMKKMNQNGTGYKLRQHIAKALQARSQAVRRALHDYNAAAAQLDPPAPHLNWNEVVQYAFLADFDILRGVRQDIREKPWAMPAGRSTMDMAFRIRRAREEVTRIQVEIRRHITYMQDERRFLKQREEEVYHKDSLLAYQIHLYRLRRGRADKLHMKQYRSLKNFTETLEPGEAVTKIGADVSTDAMPTETPEVMSDNEPDDIEANESDMESSTETDEEDANEASFIDDLNRIMAV